ncbi:hypothetical protein NSZ01_07430 [Nocardioides szechwanensis]|uniref:Uncharacterized protein n=1 Tax=Nocardioides szechwanensis TaxID=1005944 RepID=A0A1G9VB98_9ACTN|nr:hypothetical protein [Nocardioides szechwanensis]GEP32975.1 hypothetical protein NSZ01_07430 [Nocardioides szechwanensis]SDM69508.1 hypothetical protein SAMN05192576_0715 [Nocardioides szechwanensis]
MISTLVALPYELARLPLVLVDRSLSRRLAEDSPARATLDRTIGSADKLAGAVLRNGDLARRGVNRIERSDKLATAARLEQEAEARREQARDTAAAGRQEAARKRKAAQERATSGLDEADIAEVRGKQEAKARAEKTAAAKKAAADKRAAQRTATAEQRKQRVEAAAEAKLQAAEREAKDELAEARETKQSAAEARADAERLSDLTEAKKQERKQDS